jgi:translation initiation factor 2 subunit 3
MARGISIVYMAKKAAPIQPQVNIGLIGHVDHGKTTLTERLSGKWTDTHSEEIKRGITIRLGYADTEFRKCKKCDSFTIDKKCQTCGEKTELVRKVSFVDAPGHESLMATMLAGTTLMDGAILLVAANDECPQPQTREHLMALEIIGIKNVIIAQNKIDLVSAEQAKKNYDQIKAFIKGTAYEKAPIIPIAAQHGINMDLLIAALEKHIPTPKRDDSKEPVMHIARSFDINKPGAKIDAIVGGVIGGSLEQGKLKDGEEIEIRPGFKVEERNKINYIPITTKIIGLMTGKTKIDEAIPGGSIALLTKLDPSVVKSDQLTGSVVGLPGKLPPVWDELDLEFSLLERVVGAKDNLVVDPLKVGEILMLNVNSAATVGVISSIKGNNLHCTLKLPVCSQKDARVTMSRRFGNRWRLIGFGLIK